ncbi:autotransporter outer membrane beta-barrel domain-containing protein [Pseudomonas fluorescens]|jgi:outer membrane autotransporter protein|uniref:autotransporter outer membrane beta-barrel domain-containing protein n=1 Tax=Pseudomonas glycinae TaxID=1785145 RepID=UPI000D255D27|nr:autotransporter outer membrane beta-barrel domain-containing protein [Pseudomonas glycinae]AWA39806.1 autotransporter outer membrane beta-barrel domain-containing protein [Pseudomonas fluorescens]
MKFEKIPGLTFMKFTGVLTYAVVIMTTSEPANARNLQPGEVATVSTGATPEAWFVPTTATLNINGASALDIQVGGGALNGDNATTSQIDASAGARVDLGGSTVTSTGFEAALALTDSLATLSNSTLISQGAALTLARDLLTAVGSTATVTGSTLHGGTFGAAVTSLSTLNLINTQVSATDADGIGLALFGGNANVSARSKITGGLNGVTFGQDTVANPGDVTGQSHLILDNATVEGISGAAITVDLATPAGQPVLIDVNNGSRLIGGNGNILEVVDGAAAQFQVDNSKLSGNIEVAEGGIASVSLRNAATLDGNLINVDSVKLDTQSVLTGKIQGTGAGAVVLDNNARFTGAVSGVSSMSVSRGAEWNMAGSSNSVSRLDMQGGAVRFGTDQAYSQLDIATLSGNGQFFMRTDVGTAQTDFLNVTESATGQHGLVVEATASEPASGALIKVGNIASGDAQFSLQSGQVDIGALAYKLVREGEGLYLQPDGTTPSTGSQTALAISGTVPTVIQSEMTTLNTRLGDRRMAGTQPRAQSEGALSSNAQDSSSGLWIRTYGNQYNVKSAYGNGFNQHQTGVSVGVDKALPFWDGQWLIGVFGGYSNTRLDLARGSSGTIDSGYAGLYLTWFDQATGYYVDTVGKINRFNNDVKVTLSDDTRTKGNFKNLGLSGTVEVGKHIPLNHGYFIEPSAQIGLAAVEGKRYHLDNGLQVDSDETRSVLGKVGMTVGSELTLDNGSKLQPRLRAAVSHEFVNNNRVSVNDTSFNNDLSSTSLELTGGMNWVPVNKKWQVYAEVGTSRGTKVDQELGGSVGLSYNF